MASLAKKRLLLNLYECREKLCLSRYSNVESLEKEDTSWEIDIYLESREVKIEIVTEV